MWGWCKGVTNCCRRSALRGVEQQEPPELRRVLHRASAEPYANLVTYLVERVSAPLGLEELLKSFVDFFKLRQQQQPSGYIHVAPVAEAECCKALDDGLVQGCECFQYAHPKTHCQSPVEDPGDP